MLVYGAMKNVTGQGIKPRALLLKPSPPMLVAALACRFVYPLPVRWAGGGRVGFSRTNTQSRQRGRRLPRAKAGRTTATQVGEWPPCLIWCLTCGVAAVSTRVVERLSIAWCCCCFCCCCCCRFSRRSFLLLL